MSGNQAELTPESTMFKSLLTSKTAAVRRDVAFGVLDKRGRQIGAVIYTIEETFTATDSARGAVWCVEPGTWFAWWPQATRDGVKYGALQGRRRFRTAEERDADIERYLADARKRASKAA